MVTLNTHPERDDNHISESETTYRCRTDFKKILAPTLLASWALSAFAFTFVVLTIVSVTSCSTNRYSDVTERERLNTELCNYVALVNRETQPVFNGYKITKAEMGRRGLTFFVSVEDSVIEQYEKLMDNPYLAKECIYTTMQQSPRLMEICDNLQTLHLPLIFLFYSHDETILNNIFTIPTEKLAMIRDYQPSEVDKTKQMLYQTALETKNSCPSQIEEGCMMTDCRFDGENIIYTYTCTPLYYNAISERRNEIKRTLSKNIQNDPVMTVIANKCADVNVNIQYCHKDIRSGNSELLTYNTLTKCFDK